MKELTVVMVSYNTCKITQKSLSYLFSLLKREKLDYEVYVVDNNSSDSSQEMLKGLKNRYEKLRLILNQENFGFAKANNLAFSKISSKYVLLLNSDVFLTQNLSLKALISFLDSRPDVGALTVRVLLPNGRIDWASHRGFPTLWNSFCYFMKLEHLSKHVPLLRRIFGGYHLYNKSLDSLHEVDVISGAFFLVRNELLKDLNGFDERFFMYGEDIDLSLRIKQRGFKIVYYPKYSVLHLKYKSGLKSDNKQVKRDVKHHFYDAMKIFYRKHYAKRYPSWVNKLVLGFIEFKKAR